MNSIANAIPKNELRLKKGGRQVQMLPWVAQTPCPWKPGYVRVFIPFTKEELRNAKGTARGHEQIVRMDNIVRH